MISTILVSLNKHLEHLVLPVTKGGVAIIREVMYVPRGVVLVPGMSCGFSSNQVQTKDELKIGWSLNTRWSCNVRLGPSPLYGGHLPSL